MKNKVIAKFFSIALSGLTLFGGLFYYPAEPVLALDSEIKINEVMYDPMDGVEWVELYNAGADDVDLDGWVLTDEDGAEEYIFTSSVIFPAGSFLIIRSDSGTDDLDFTDNLGVIYANHGSDYSGTVDQVSLYNGQDEIMDFIAWGGDAGVDDDSAVLAGIWTVGAYFADTLPGSSLGLIVDGEDNNDLSDWQEFEHPTYGLSNEYINQPPQIIETLADPDPIIADGASSVLLIAEINDPDGLSDITLVEIDLSVVGGNASQEMFDDGSHGDDVPGDGIYSYETTIPISIAAGDYQLSVAAMDSVGNIELDDLNLAVEEIIYEEALRINELLPNPSGPEATDEFIEIYNYSSKTVDLNGWYLEDAGGTKYVIKSGDFNSTNIPASGYFTIYRDKSKIALNNTGDSVYLYQPNETLLYSVEYLESALDDYSYNFNNGSWQWSTTLTPNAANVITLPNQNPTASAGSDLSGTVGDKIIFDGTDSSDPDADKITCSWDFGDGGSGSGCSISHVYLESGSYTAILTVKDGKGGEAQDTVKVAIAEKSMIDSGPYSDQVIVNEFLPNPAGTDTNAEFIELYNQGKAAVNLSGWKIDDEDGGSSPYTISEGTSIAAGGYLVFYNSDTKISINNSGDAVRLISPDEKIADEQRYEGSAKDDQSYARDDLGSFQWTNTLTPGKKNVINLPAEEEDDDESDAASVNSSSTTVSASSDSEADEINIISISQAKAKDKNTAVKVRGVVTVPPKVISETYFYIQDDTAGVQIYFSKKDFPNLKLGDQIEVSGKVSEISGEKKINIADKNDIKIISAGNNRTPAEITTGSVKENFEGSLVRVSGQITKQSGNTFYIDDGSGEIKIYIQKSTNIKKPEWKKGDWVTITGVVGQTSTGYRVMPRYQEDLQTGKNVFGAGDIPAAGIKINDLIIIGSILLLAFILLAIRKPSKRAWFNKY